MSFDQKLNQAAELARAGRFEEAELACRLLLEKRPKSFDALQLLGLAQAQLGRASEAVSTLSKAIAKDRGHAGVRNNLGNALMSLGRFEEAHRCFKQAVEISPKGPEAYVGLGSALLRLGRYDEAHSALERALRWGPDLPQANDALGVCLMHRGKLREAMHKHLSAAEANPPLPGAFVNLFNTMMFMHVTDDARRVADAGIATLAASSAEVAELQLGLAKLSWLEGRLEEIGPALDACESLTRAFEGYFNISNARAYHRLLRTLLKLRTTYEGEAYDGDPHHALFFVSDSHGLPPSETVVYEQGRPRRVLSALLTGARASAIASDIDNEQVASLQAIVRAIPAGHPIVFAIGEGDCRLRPGVVDPDRESTRRMVDRYVERVFREAVEYDHRVWLYGVSAPHPVVLQSAGSERQRHIDFIRFFNDALRESCRSRGLGLVDVHAYTADVEGVADGERHIDEYHLHPETLRNLMERPPR